MIKTGGKVWHRIVRIKYFVLCGACVIPVSLAIAQTPPADNAAQEILRQQERERVLRQQQENRPQVRLQPSAAAQQDHLRQGETPCFRIDHIILAGEAAEHFQWALSAADPEGDPATGRCLGAGGIGVVLKRVQNAIVARGFVTTRVLAAPQDIKAGVLTLTLIAGRIHAIRFTEDSSAHATWRNAIPAVPGDILNLRDIEQGLENLKRVPTADAGIQITPAEGEGVKPGESDLLITWKQTFPLRLSLSADDSGSKATGKYQGSATLSWDDPLRLNDLLYFSYNHNLDTGDGKGTHGYTGHYEVPWSYWLLGATGSGYNYRQSIAGANGPIFYSGASENQEVALTRVVQRDARGKSTVSLKAWRRSSNNFIDDTEVLVQRRVEGGWALELGRTQSWGNATVQGSLAYKKGTGAFGSLTAPEDPYGEGTSRLGLISANLKLDTPFQLAGQNLRYSGEVRAQWNRTPLVQLDQFAIGGRYTVRGFDGEQQLLAERGWLWRNELAWAIGQTGQQVYAGLDHGEVGGPSAANLVGTSLTGAVLGVRGGVKRFAYDAFIGVPVDKPKYFSTAPWVVGLNVNWSI
jgi:hemolysin activation/secretion protein